MKSDLIALIDMDGSVADFSGEMIRQLNKIKSPTEPVITQVEDPPEWLERRISLIKLTPGFWEGLPIIDPGMQVVDLLRRHNFKLNILTKGPAKTNSAWSEKLEWCRKHIPDAAVTITEDKGLVYGRVLFDDWPNYILRWLEWRPRGTVLMLDQPWNQKFSHPNVIRIRKDFINSWDDYNTIIQSLVKASGR
jgi:5'-nucleotidase